MCASVGRLRPPAVLVRGAYNEAETGGRPGAGGRRSTSTSNYVYGNLNLHFITDGKAAAHTLSLLIPQPPPGHDPVRVSYPWAPMC